MNHIIMLYILVNEKKPHVGNAKRRVYVGADHLTTFNVVLICIVTFYYYYYVFYLDTALYLHHILKWFLSDFRGRKKEIIKSDLFVCPPMNVLNMLCAPLRLFYVH